MQEIYLVDCENVGTPTIIGKGDYKIYYFINNKNYIFGGNPLYYEIIQCNHNGCKDAMDFMLRKFKINGMDAAILAIDGLISKQQVSIGILNPIMEAAVQQPDGKAAMQYIEKYVLGFIDAMRLQTVSDVIDRLMNGFAVLFLDGCDYALCFGTQGFDRRGISEPEKEVMQRGSREGFVEAFLINVSMISSRVQSFLL